MADNKYATTHFATWPVFGPPPVRTTNALHWGVSYVGATASTVITTYGSDRPVERVDAIIDNVGVACTRNHRAGVARAPHHLIAVGQVKCGAGVVYEVQRTVGECRRRRS